MLNIFLSGQSCFLSLVLLFPFFLLSKGSGSWFSLCCTQNEHKLISFCSATDSHCYLTSLDLFPSTQKYQLLLLSSVPEVSQICSQVHKVLILFIFRVQCIPALLTTAAHPPGQCAAPSWALQMHSSASWRRCCFLRLCPKQSNHLGEQLQAHAKEKSVCQ